MEWLICFIIVMIVYLITALVKAICARAIGRICEKEKGIAADEEKCSRKSIFTNFN